MGLFAPLFAKTMRPCVIRHVLSVWANNMSSVIAQNLVIMVIGKTTFLFFQPILTQNTEKTLIEPCLTNLWPLKTKKKKFLKTHNQFDKKNNFSKLSSVYLCVFKVKKKLNLTSFIIWNHQWQFSLYVRIWWFSLSSTKKKLKLRKIKYGIKMQCLKNYRGRLPDSLKR